MPVLYLRISTVFLPSLLISSLPAHHTALLEAILLYINLGLGSEELKPRTYLPPSPRDFQKNERDCEKMNLTSTVLHVTKTPCTQA